VPVEEAEPLVLVWPEQMIAPRDEEPSARAHPPEPAISAEAPTESAPGIDLLAWGFQTLLVAYALGAGYFGMRWMLGIIGLARLLRQCEPAADWVQEAARERLPGVRVLCSPRVEVPFSCGVLRPTIVLPAGLAERATSEELTWVLAHEAAHLRRGDPRSFWLLSLASILFHPFPWFWGLRARWRLDQEYLADAEAVACGPRVEYAEFLLQWTTRPRAQRLPAAAVGVLGRSSDLFRRITMLLRGTPSLESRCPRLWSALVAPTLLAFAIVAAGIGFQADAAPVQEPEKKAEPKKGEPKPVPAVPGVPQLPNLPAIPDIDDLFPEDLPGLPEQFKQIQEEMKRAREEARRAMDELRLQFPGGGLQLQPFRMAVGGRTSSRLGAQVSKPSATLVDQLDLPMNQGLVLERVEENSAAAKAGLKSHDILLELAGKPVSDNPAELMAQLRELKADQAIEAVVLRKGRKEMVKNLTLPEARPARVLGNLPGAIAPFRFPNVFPGGANTTLTVVRNGDTFTTQCNENDVKMTLTGTVADGKGTLTEASITENGETNKYDSLDKVPEAHRARVKELVEMSGTGQVKLNR
jgi:hypothetical protein